MFVISPHKIKYHARGLAESAWHPHMRHKIILLVAYSTHIALEHVGPEGTAGVFYYVLEILHAFVG